MNLTEFKKLDTKQKETTLKQLSDKYYNGESIISDDLFDSFVDHLKLLDPKNPYFNEVGALPNNKQKVKLPVYMGSLDKVKPDTKEFNRFIEKSSNIVMSEKLDGISVLLEYNNGKLRAFTRGNGTIGTIITNLVEKRIPNLKENILVRGELILPKNFIGNSKNLRNIVSGLANSKTADSKILEKLQVVAYSLPNSTLSVYDQFLELDKLGFNTPRYKIINISLENDPNNYFIDILTNWREESIYEIDGIVISRDLVEIITIGKNPKQSVAFKTILKDQIKESEVIDIIWNITKDNYLKPVIVINPVNIGGAKISRVTGINAGYLKNNDIGIGSNLKIIRSGDVIPKILEVLSAGVPKYPDISYTWTENNVDIVANGENNKAILLYHFTKNIGVKFINLKQAERLVKNDKGTIKDLVNLKISDLENIDGLGKKSAQNIVESIEQSLEKCSIFDLMVATNKLGRNFGRNRLQLITQELGKEVFLQPPNNLIDLVANINGFSHILANQFAKKLSVLIKFINDSGLRDLYNEKISQYKVNKISIENTLTICFSGARPKEIIKKLENKGHKISSALNNNVDVLIVKDINQTSTKIEKAKKSGKKIICVNDIEAINLL